jgi:hypothetical protein
MKSLFGTGMDSKQLSFKTIIKALIDGAGHSGFGIISFIIWQSTDSIPFSTSKSGLVILFITPRGFVLQKFVGPVMNGQEPNAQQCVED